MHAGDGTLYRTNSNSLVWELRGGLDETEYYQNHIVPLIQRLFSLSLTPKHRSGGGTGSFGVQTSKKMITSFIAKYFPIGSKSRIVRIPPEVIENNLFIPFIRGLFDTDGCVRFDKNHGAKAKYPKIEFATASFILFSQVCDGLDSLELGYHDWVDGTYHKLCIPGRTNLSRYLQLIGFHNPKHLNKVQKGLEN